jgi:hypothetical protein
MDANKIKSPAGSGNKRLQVDQNHVGTPPGVRNLPSKRLFNEQPVTSRANTTTRLTIGSRSVPFSAKSVIGRVPVCLIASEEYL